MEPRSWRISENLTLRQVSRKSRGRKDKKGISVSYLSEVERGIEAASGRVITLYHKLSKGRVSPADFKRKR